MKLNRLKGTFLAVLLAFGVAGNAAAALQDGSQPAGNSALIFSAWDSATSKSYTRGLGYFLNDFLPTTAPGSLSFTDSAFTGLFGSSIAGNTTLLWNVVAVDATTLVAPNQYRVAATNTQQTPTITQSQNLNAAINTDSFIRNKLNASPFATGPNTGSITSSSAADVWNINNSTSGFGSTLGAGYTTAGGVAQSLFFLLTADAGTGTRTPVGTRTLYGSTAPSTWTLQSDGTLVWNNTAAVSAVPVPAAAWLLGSGFIGLIGVARRRDGNKDGNTMVAA